MYSVVAAGLFMQGVTVLSLMFNTINDGHEYGFTGKLYLRHKLVVIKTHVGWKEDFPMILCCFITLINTMLL